MGHEGPWHDDGRACWPVGDGYAAGVAAGIEQLRANLKAATSRNALLETQLSDLQSAHSQALKDIEALPDVNEAATGVAFHGYAVDLAAVLHALTPPSNPPTT